MGYLVLARKFRPQTFEQVVGQEHITQTLNHAVSSGRVAHAILFSGPRGTGKTTVARLLAKAMNCEGGPTSEPCNHCRSCREITAGGAVDVFEIDGASNNSVDQIRELRDNVKYLPAHSLYKIYIIDEVHMLSIAAFNALLKTLEEPPAHVMFMFATTEPQKIPVTILSRCQRYDFRRIRIDDIVRHMQMIGEKEGVLIDEKSLWMIGCEAGGSMRDALSLLDQVISCADGEVGYEQVLNILGGIDREILFEMSGAVLDADIPAVLNIVNDANDRGYDLKKFYENLVDHFRNLMVVKMGKAPEKLVDVPEVEIQRMQEQIQACSPVFLTQVFECLFHEGTTIKYSLHPRMALEIILIKIAGIRPVLPIEVLIEKLDMLRQDVARHGNVSCRPPVEGAVVCGCDSDAEKPSPPCAEEKTTEELVESTPLPESHATSPEMIWKKVQDVIRKKHPALWANMADCRLKRFSDECLELEINGSRFNLGMIRREKNMVVLKNVCREISGRQLDIVLHGNVKSQENRQIKKQADDRLKQEALSHPVVAETLEIFHGKIEDIKIV